MTEDRGTRTAYVIAIIGLLCLAGIVRAAPLTAGLPYTAYVDEGHVLGPTVHMLAERTPDPAAYQYPPLLMETIAASGLAYDVVDSDDWADQARRADDSAYFDAIEPTELVLFGRLIVFGFALGTVLLATLLGARLLGRFGGLIAGTVVAFTPALVQRSPIVIVDTPAAFFVMLTLLVTLHLQTTKRPLLSAAVAGAAAGAAFASKYPSGAVLLVPVVVLALQRDHPWRPRVTQGLVATLAAGVVAVVLMPALLLRPRTVISDIQAAAEKYDAKASPQSYAQQLFSTREVGVLMVCLAAVGLFLLVRGRRSRALTLGWLAFAVVEVGSLLWTDYQPFRNVLPTVPFLGIAVAAAVLAISGWVAHLSSEPRRASRGVAMAITIALCLTMLVWGILPITRVQTIVDSRQQARSWMQDEIGGDERTVVAEELAFLPSELEKVPGTVVVMDAAAMADLDPNDFDYAVWGRFTQDAVRRGRLPDGWSFVQGFGVKRTPAAPGLGRGTNEAIAIYRS